MSAHVMDIRPGLATQHPGPRRGLALETLGLVICTVYSFLERLSVNVLQKIIS